MKARVGAWLDPFGSEYDAYQIIQGMYGQAWGGLVGRGFGSGLPERIPYAESDFIVAAIGEELGLTAVMAVILCYGLIVERALRIALISRDGFGKLMAVGLGSIFALQVFVVVGGVTGLIPLTGLTTPFLSYGGSSLVANWAIIALLLRISDQARRPLPDLSADDAGDLILLEDQDRSLWNRDQIAEYAALKGYKILSDYLRSLIEADMRANGVKIDLSVDRGGYRIKGSGKESNADE